MQKELKNDAYKAIEDALNSDTTTMGSKASIANAKSLLYVAESIQELNQTIKNSTEETTLSNKKFTNATLYLTFALMCLTVLQVLFTFWQGYEARFSNELQMQEFTCQITGQEKCAEKWGYKLKK